MINDMPLISVFVKQLHKSHFQFIKKRKVFYGISVIASVIALVAIFTKGFTLGVDFSGGRTYTVAYEQAVNLEEVRENLDEVFGLTTEVKTFGSENQVRVTTTYHVAETSDELEKLLYLDYLISLELKME